MSTEKKTPVAKLPDVPFKVSPKKPSQVYKTADKKSDIFCTAKGGTYTIVKVSEDGKWGLLGSDVGWIMLSDFRVLK